MSFPRTQPPNTAAAPRRQRKPPRVPRQYAAAWRIYRGDLLALALLSGVLALFGVYAATLAPSHIAASAERMPAATRLADIYGLEHNATMSFFWTKPEATIGLPLSAPGNYRLTLTLAGGSTAPPDRTIAVSVNGVSVATFPLEPELRDYTITFYADPAWWVQTESHTATVVLTTEGFTPPADQRLLGVILAGVALDPLASSPWQPGLLAPVLLLLAVGYGAARLLGAARWSAMSGAAGVIVALGCVALGGQAGLYALYALPSSYPRGTVGLAAIALAIAICIRLTRRSKGHNATSSEQAEVAGLQPTHVGRWRILIVLTFLALCFGFFFQLPAWNEFSRFDLTRALADDRSTSIDPYHLNTEDKSFANGHYRSDKVPGVSILAVPPYLFLRGLTALPPFPSLDPERLLPLITLGLAGLPTLGLVYLLARYLRRHIDEGWALAIGAGYALATIAFPFATMFFGHALAAFLLFALFSLLVDADPGTSTRRYLLAGFIAGWAILVELPLALGVVILFAYAGWRNPRALVPLITGGIPLALVMFAYNYAAFGDPFSIGYANLDNAAFAESMDRSFFGVGMPRLSGLYTITIGPLGLLRFAPWLLCGLAGVWAGWRTPQRAQVLVCAAICGAFVAYNSAYFLPLGGGTPGPRFLIPTMPFAAALVGLAPRRWRPYIGAQILCSAAIFLMVTATEPKLWSGLGDLLADFWLPRFLSGQFTQTTAALWGWPPLVVLGLAAALTLGALAAIGRPQRRLRQVGIGLTALLLALTLACGLPLDLRPAPPATTTAPGVGAHAALRAN